MSRILTIATVAAAATVVLAAQRPAVAQVAAAAGDPVQGQKQFGQCAVCHDATKGGPDKIGPNLYGVFGSKAATRRVKYAYSPALKASKLTWDEATLDRWLTDPGTTVKGTKMEFVGLARKPVRQNVIAYLKTLK